MRASDSRLDLDAARLAACEVLTIDTSRSLSEAVQLMVEHQAAHLIVIEADRPAGVLSTYDIAAAISASAEGDES
jgi:CBS domain-containing protein